MNKRIKALSKYARYLVLILGLIFLSALATAFTQSRALFTIQFWLAVMVNMLPGIVIVVVAWGLAGNFARRMYDQGNVRQGIRLLLLRRFGKIGMSPIMVLSQGKVMADSSRILACGGPATLVVHNDTAVVLEKAGRLTRVQGSGFPSLEPFEKIYDVIDLRPKSWRYPVKAMTKEGILITWEVEVQYQINDGNLPPATNGGAQPAAANIQQPINGSNQQPDMKKPYPFEPDKVFQAATNKWRRERGRIQDVDWEGRVVIGQTEGNLRSILARRHLDELIGLTEADRLAVRETIQTELEEILRQEAPKVGAKILKVKLDNLKVDDEITQQLLENWRSNWYTWSTCQLAEGEVAWVKANEQADADAHLVPLNAMTQVLKELGSEQDINTVISMRLITALARARLGNEMIFAPSAALDTLQKFQAWLEEGIYSTPDFSTSAPSSSASPDILDKFQEWLREEGNSMPPSFSPAPAAAPSPKRRLKSMFLLGSSIVAGSRSLADDEITGKVHQIGEAEFEFDDGQSLVLKQICKGSRLEFNQAYDYVVMPVAGDSMNRAGIDSGDYVILQMSNLSSMWPKAGDIVAVAFWDQEGQKSVPATLKRIHFKGHDFNQADEFEFRPESSNSKYRPFKVSRQAFALDNPQGRIVGIVAAVLGRANNQIQDTDQSL